MFKKHSEEPSEPIQSEAVVIISESKIKKLSEKYPEAMKELLEEAKE